MRRSFIYFVGRIILLVFLLLVEFPLCFYLSIFHADQSGDAANLRKATHVPAFVWALLFVAFSLWMAYCSASVVNGMIAL